MQEITLEQEATELGLQRGWDHANYCDAYGIELHNYTPDIPLRFTEIATFYTSGWEEGRERFENDQFPDGSPMDETSDVA